MKNKRKALSKRQRFEVFKRDSFTCQYCGNKAPDVVLNIDHIIPFSKGGGDEITNLVTSCFDCNIGKSNKTLSDDSAVKLQMKSLDELNQKKEQIDMIAEWAYTLNKDHEIEAINNLIDKIDGSQLTELGIKNIKKLIDKYGFKAVAESIPKAYQKHDNQYMNMLSKYMNYINSSEYDRHIMYSIGILKNRLHYYNKYKNAMYIKRAKELGMPKEWYRELVLSAKNWTEYSQKIENAISDNPIMEQ